MVIELLELLFFGIHGNMGQENRHRVPPFSTNLQFNKERVLKRMKDLPIEVFKTFEELKALSIKELKVTPLFSKRRYLF